jgi:hypothetical protein
MTHSFSVSRDDHIYKIIWPMTPIKYGAFKSVTKWFIRHSNYAPMIKAKSNTMSNVLGTINKKYNTALTMQQILSIRNIVIKYKIVSNYQRMNNIISEIATKYKGGMHILDISKIYDFPPLNLLRGILIFLNYDEPTIYNIFSGKCAAETLLSGRDLDQFKIAEKNDATNIINQQIIVKIAYANEDRLVNYFKTLGIRIKTQNDLIDEQHKKFGRAIITPDILFIDEVYINGRRVHWLEYKDYAGTTVGFLYRSNIAQTTKYVKKWGPGAICYRHSYVDNMNIPNVMMLDAQTLPINFE